MSFLEVIMLNPIGQLLWLIAMAIAFFALIQKDDQKTLQIIIISMSFWALHFYVMEVYSALVATIIWILRVFLSLKYKKNKRIFLWIVAATIVGWVMTFENNFSLLPIIWSIISAYGYFFFDRLRLRMFMFVTSIFWFTFNLSTWSLWGILNEILIQILLIITMYKMIHEEWKRVYFVDKIMSIIRRPKTSIDVGRYINIYDILKIKRKSVFTRMKKYAKNKKNNLKKILKNKKSS